MSHDKEEEEPTKERICGYVIYPWEVDSLATADQVLPMLERLHYLNFTPMLSTIYLKSTGFFTWDRQIAYSLMRKADVVLLVYEEHMTPIMLRELMKAKSYGKKVVRIPRKAD